jgi:hypothetical protein
MALWGMTDEFSLLSPPESKTLLLGSEQNILRV